jgi:hypothetical protein
MSLLQNLLQGALHFQYLRSRTVLPANLSCTARSYSYSHSYSHSYSYSYSILPSDPIEYEYEYRFTEYE